MEFTKDITEFVHRYAAVWNEPDPAARRSAIAELWAEDGVEVIESAEYRGHAALEARVAEAYQKFVGTGQFVFKPANDAVGHHDAVWFSVYMAPAAGGDIAWTGTVFLLLGADGRIQHDYQFAGGVNPAAGEGERTRAAVEEFLRRMVAGDPDRLADLFAETIDWRLDWPVEGHPAVPWIRSRSTRADAVDHFRALDTFHLPEKRGGALPEILVEGPDAVVLGDIRQTVRASGKSYVARCALRLTVEAGLITRYHVYEDSLTVAEAFAE